MTFDPSFLLDFVASLAMLAALASSLRWLKRMMRPARAEAFLGAMFGCVAILQMASPMTVAPGIIVDLRCVTVALAGAFLGMPGLMICLAMACGYRMLLGGVGMGPGVVSVIIAGSAGLGWATVMRDRYGPDAELGLRTLLVLAAFVSSHLIGFALLPPDAAGWLITYVAPLLLAFNFVAIPLIGSLIQLEERAILSEGLMRRAASEDPGTGLMTHDGLLRAAQQRRADTTPGQGAGVIVVRLRNAPWIRDMWGRDGRDVIYGVLRRRLGRLLPAHALLGLTDRDEIVVYDDDVGETMLDHIEATILHDLAHHAISVEGDARITVGIRTQSAWSEHPTELPALLGMARTDPRPARRDGTAGPTAAGAQLDATRDRLFAQADRRLARGA